MTDSSEKDIQPIENSRSWIIYCGQGALRNIQRKIDMLFSEYSFYPEIDWQKYGYLPPEGYQVLGAWRHPDTTLFAFLLDNPKIKSIGKIPQLLLLALGEIAELSKIDFQISNLKIKIEKADTKEDNVKRDEERLVRISKKPLGALIGVLAVFTAIINGFSLYLRKIPLPEFGSSVLLSIYIFILALVHYSALILLLIVILICLGFLIKYGIIYIRRM